MQRKTKHNVKILTLSLILLGFILAGWYAFDSSKNTDLDIFYTDVTTGKDTVTVQLESNGSLNDLKVGDQRTISLKVTEGSDENLKGMIFSILVPPQFDVSGLTSESSVNNTNRKSGFNLNINNLEPYVFTQEDSSGTHVRIAAASTGDNTFKLSNGNTIATFNVTAKSETGSGTANIRFEIDTTPGDSNGEKSYPAIAKSGTGTLADLDVLKNEFNTLAFKIIKDSGCNTNPNVDGEAGVGLGDLFYVFDRLGTGDTSADLDCDGSVGLQDLFNVFDNIGT